MGKACSAGNHSSGHSLGVCSLTVAGIHTHESTLISATATVTAPAVLHRHGSHQNILQNDRCFGRRNDLCAFLKSDVDVDLSNVLSFLLDGSGDRGLYASRKRRWSGKADHQGHMKVKAQGIDGLAKTVEGKTPRKFGI